MNNLKILLTNKKTSLILTLTFVTTLLPYIILPFLAIFTLQKDEISIAQVGLIIGTQSLATSVFGLFSGWFEKRIGTKSLLSFSIVVIGVCYILYAHAQSLLACLIIMVCLGATNGIQGPIMKSILANNKSTVSSDFVFRLRYMIFCVAIILGPIISQLLYLSFRKEQLFIITGALHLITGILCLIFYTYISGVTSESEKTISSNKKSSLCLDKSILFSCIVGIISFSVFSIFESATPLAFNEYSDNVTMLFASLIVLNSVIALIIQPIIIRIVDKISLKYVFYIGSILFSMSYFVFAYSEGIFMLIILGTIIFTLAEGFLIPSIDVLVDTISNKENKTSYFAIAEFKQLGFFIGPLLSGLLIDYFNPSIMYIFFGLFSLIICVAINIIPLGKN